MDCASYTSHVCDDLAQTIAFQLIGHGLNTPSQLQLYGVAPEGGIWAPTLRYYGLPPNLTHVSTLPNLADDTYFLFTTNRRVYTTELRQMSRVYFVTTKDIFSNRWSEPRYLDVEGYDADIFIENGTVWVTRSDINNPLDKVVFVCLLSILVAHI
jgi:beta-xylosidase